ncbi:MAG TPA: hypothetical protein VES58_03365, partial [Syntrophobacteria bacterium]|nr:hypothetical protein [Syntrophobacteria bacterium]
MGNQFRGPRRRRRSRQGDLLREATPWRDCGNPTPPSLPAFRLRRRRFLNRLLSARRSPEFGRVGEIPPHQPLIEDLLDDP